MLANIDAKRAHFLFDLESIELFNRRRNSLDKCFFIYDIKATQFLRKKLLWATLFTILNGFFYVIIASTFYFMFKFIIFNKL